MTCCWEWTVVCFWYKPPMALKILYVCELFDLLFCFTRGVCMRAGVVSHHIYMPLALVFLPGGHVYKCNDILAAILQITDFNWCRHWVPTPPIYFGGGEGVRQIFEVCFGELEKNELQGGTVVCWGDQRRFLVYYRGVSSSIQNWVNSKAIWASSLCQISKFLALTRH